MMMLDTDWGKSHTEIPRSPWSSAAQKFRYCSHMGTSRPKARMNGPVIACAESLERPMRLIIVRTGSPGASRGMSQSMVTATTKVTA